MSTPLPQSKVPKEYILKSPKGGVKIPMPSAEDLEFARNKDGETISLGDLDTFCKNGNLWGIQFSLNSGTDINNTRGDPLNFAAQNKQSMAIALLLENGANVSEALTNDKATESVKRLIRMIVEQNEQEWHPSSDTTIIHKRTFFDNAQTFYVVRSEFNFHSRKITTYTEKNGRDLNLVIERFSEQDTPDEIIAAHTELSRQRGTLNAIEDYVDGVVDKRLDAIKRIAIKRPNVR